MSKITWFAVAVAGLIWLSGITPKIAYSETGTVMTNGNESKPVDTGVLEKKTESVNAGNTICPVMGEKIGDSKVTYEYKGKIYNFCCPGCIEEFKKDPEKYIRNLK